jgi:Hpt domain
MGRRRTHKPFPGARLVAFLEPFVTGRVWLNKDTDDAQGGAVGDTESVRDGDTGFARTLPSGLSGRLASELFARLLLELPEHRRDLQAAYRDGDSEQLAGAAHKLLGAVVYCDLPQLTEALRELKRTIVSPDAGQKEPAYLRTIRLIDDLLARSGYHGD